MANVGTLDDDNLNILFSFSSHYRPIDSTNKVIKHLFVHLSPDNSFRKLFSDVAHVLLWFLIAADVFFKQPDPMHIKHR